MPARQAAPSAVVSSTSGRSTVAPVRSARRCRNQPFARHAAIHTQHIGPGAVARHGAQQVMGLVADGIQCGSAGNVGDAGVAGHAQQGATRMRIPVGCAQAREGRHHVDVMVVAGLTFTSSSLSAASLKRWRPSRSHCMAAPATKMLPSSA